MSRDRIVNLSTKMHVLGLKPKHPYQGLISTADSMVTIRNSKSHLKGAREYFMCFVTVFCNFDIGSIPLQEREYLFRIALLILYRLSPKNMWDSGGDFKSYDLIFVGSNF